MSGSSAGGYVSETPSASDEGRALDEAGQLTRLRSKFAVSMNPSLKKKRAAKAKKGGAS